MLHHSGTLPLQLVLVGRGVAIGSDRNRLHVRLEEDGMLAAPRRRQAHRVGEDFGGQSLWCSPEPGLVPEDDVRSEVREAMALALASTVVCSVLRALVRDSMVALRSAASPMSAAHDATDDDADDGGAAAGDEVDRDGEDRRERDTRLSRASEPRVAGPRLRSS